MWQKLALPNALTATKRTWPATSACSVIISRVSFSSGVGEDPAIVLTRGIAT